MGTLQNWGFSAIVPVMQVGVGIVGAGLIGRKRALALSEMEGRLVAVADSDLTKAQSLANEFYANAARDWRELLTNSQVEVVIVATPNNILAECACEAMLAGKDVLIEKPGARNGLELKKVREVAGQTGRIARIGFNHRFHPALTQLKTFLEREEIGELLGFRARYGHGGRIGYEKEWRAEARISGGGELIDQGVHLIDLCRWMGGEFELEFGRADTLYWDMAVDDNAFLFLRSCTGQKYAWLHASCTEWKNLFSFEVYGTTGKLEVNGLGGSYGVETLQMTRMDRAKETPRIETECFNAPDNSWASELKAFRQEMAGRRSEIATIDDGIRALEIVEETYRLSQSER